MTDNIKLPPEFRSGNSIPVERATIARERMVDILTEAIEADRQARGEPIGEVLAFPMDGKPQTHSTLAGLENPQPIGMLVYAAQQPTQTPEGYKLVPIEPTEEMLKAAYHATESEAIITTVWLRKTVYKAMLEAAPQSKDK